MKILWLSDSPLVPSGFGNVTRFVCAGLAKAGFDVHIVGWQDAGPSRQWEGATLHGGGRHPLGADVLLPYLYRLRPDILITLADVWWLAYLTEPSIRQFFEMTGTRWLAYFPIDGHRPDGTLPPSWVEMLRQADVPVAMSRYGQRVSMASGVPAGYVPHGVDCIQFRPATDRRPAKVELGYDDRFVILSDARNQPRKMLPRLLTIFERFARDKPDALLHLHCDPADPAAQEDRYSYRIDADVRALGLEDQVRFSRNFSIQKGLSLDDLVKVYQAADVHLLVSSGEGFGLPTLQAAACGVVPVAADYSANRELVHGHGSTIRVADFVPDEFGIGRAFVDVGDAVDRLEELYKNRALLDRYSGLARQFALPYDWSAVLPLWVDLLGRASSVAPRPQRRWPSNVVSLTGSAAAGAPSPAASLVRNAFPVTPPGVNITIRVGEQRLGEMARQIVDDATMERGSPRLRVPIARTERETPGRRARVRTAGSIYISGSLLQPAGQQLARQLREIFPLVEPWSEDVRRRGYAPYQAAWFESLCRSVLAVDLDGRGDELALWTAYAGVPTLGLASNRWQSLCWPELSLRSPDDPDAVQRARAVLTDYAAVVAMTGAARSVAQRVAPDSVRYAIERLDSLLTASGSTSGALVARELA